MDGTDANPDSDYAIADLLECLETDAVLLNDYTRETRRALRQRLSAYEALPLFASEGTNSVELMQPGRLAVMLLSGIPDDIRFTIGSCSSGKSRWLPEAKHPEAAKSLELGEMA